MKCLICGSDNIQEKDTIISDFVMARINPDYEPDRKQRDIKICYCRDCTFAFYDYRLSPTEELLLYRNYRDEEYQKTREKYECWYTAKVNAAINQGGVQKQQRIIKKVLDSYNHRELKSALDYGGNQGATFFDEIGTERKYVYDISGVDPLPGIVGIHSYEDLRKHHYDFIMCNMVFEHLVDPYDVLEKLFVLGDSSTIYYLEVPSENPFVTGNKFSISKNLSLLLDRNYSWIRLVKYYFQQRKQPFMPMKEHINFYTEKALRVMAENGGFSVIDIQENVLDNSTVLSMLFKKGKEG